MSNFTFTARTKVPLGLDGIAHRKKGSLIVFEGPDGSGKSTQLKLFKQWLLSQGQDVATTKWKSAPVISSMIKARKEAKNLSPEEYCLLHAADLRFRVENLILPALRQGKTVLCDRYVFTSLSRDVARGLSPAWIWSLFEPLLWPDLVFYFSVCPETALQRIQATREPNYYEAGQDVTHISDPSESFKVFIRRVIDKYERMANAYDFLTVNAEQSIADQHRSICARFQERQQEIGKRHTQPSIMPRFSQVAVA
jgi:dTMP kinase